MENLWGWKWLDMSCHDLPFMYLNISYFWCGFQLFHSLPHQPAAVGVDCLLKKECVGCGRITIRKCFFFGNGWLWVSEWVRWGVSHIDRTYIHIYDYCCFHWFVWSTTINTLWRMIEMIFCMYMCDIIFVHGDGVNANKSNYNMYLFDHSIRKFVQIKVCTICINKSSPCKLFIFNFHYFHISILLNSHLLVCNSIIYLYEWNQLDTMVVTFCGSRL